MGASLGCSWDDPGEGRTLASLHQHHAPPLQTRVERLSKLRHGWEGGPACSKHAQAHGRQMSRVGLAGQQWVQGILDTCILSAFSLHQGSAEDDPWVPPGGRRETGWGPGTDSPVLVRQCEGGAC